MKERILLEGGAHDIVFLITRGFKDNVEATIEPKHTNNEDAAIIGRVLGGDTNAFEGLMVKYETAVVNQVRFHVPANVIQETVQEVFIRAYRSLGSCKNHERFGAWLSSIAEKTCYDALRRQYRHKEKAISSLSNTHEDWLDHAMAEQSREDYERQLERQEAREVLEWAMSHLSPKDRMVVELVHLQERSVEETAKSLGWSAVNVKVRAHRSRKKLRSILEGLSKRTRRPHETD